MIFSSAFKLHNTNETTHKVWLMLLIGMQFCLLTLCGCSRFRKSSEGRYETIGSVPVAQAEQAKKLNADALKAARKGNWEKAEQLLKEALESEVNYAPAHNNLGQIYLRRHQLYLAAWEFEFAINLMPDRVEPYINLGLVYETAGQLDKAAEAYESALQRASDSREAISCCARVAVKQDNDPGRTAWLLQQVVMHDDRQEWVRWAQDLVATRYASVIADPGTLDEAMQQPRHVRGDSFEYLPEPVEINQPYTPSSMGGNLPASNFPATNFPGNNLPANIAPANTLPQGQQNSRVNSAPIPKRAFQADASANGAYESNSANLFNLGLQSVPETALPYSEWPPPSPSAGAGERK